ncbi:hypothetical protein JNW89_15470, partial [Micromonospora sp. 4G55]|nr:hypothetical protein [Micromonospora sp. 4G55]
NHTSPLNSSSIGAWATVDGRGRARVADALLDLAQRGDRTPVLNR